MNKYKYLLENVLIFGLGSVVSKVAAFFLLALFTKYMDTSDFGDAELVVTTISLLIPVFTFSISDAVLRFLFSVKNIKGVITVGIIITLFGFVLITVLSPLCLFFDSLKKYVIYLVVIFLLNSCEQLFFNVSKGLEFVKLCAFNSLTSVLALSFSSYVFIVNLGLGLHGYLISIAFSHFVCSCYLFWGCKLYKYIDYKDVDTSLIKNMLSYSIPFVPSTVAWWVNSLSDRYFVVLFLGSAMNGLYSAAAKIPNIISIFTTIFHQAWQLSGIKEYNSEEYSSFYSNIYNLYTVFMLCFCSILLCCLPLISVFLFKGDFGSAWLYVPFLIIGSLFSGLSGVLSPAYLAANKTNILMYSTILGSLLNIIINLCLLRKFGLQVASISTFISFVLVWIVRLFLINKYVKIKIKWGYFLASVVLILIQSITMLIGGGNTNITYLTCVIIIVFSTSFFKNEIMSITYKILRKNKDV